MKNTFCFLIIAVSATLTVGCSDSASKEENKKLQEGLTQKEFDINKVPPDKRPLIQAMIDNQKKGQAQAESKK